MRLMKGFLFVASGFFILITCISLLIPSRVMTAKTVVIHAQPKKILAAISDLQAWKQWHPVFKIDSSAVFISNPSTAVNATAVWSSSNKKNKTRSLYLPIMVSSLRSMLWPEARSPSFASGTHLARRPPPSMEPS